MQGDTVTLAQCELDKRISPYASHFLMLDDDSCTGDEILGSDLQKSNFRHFHYKMIEAMEETREYAFLSFYLFFYLLFIYLLCQKFIFK